VTATTGAPPPAAASAPQSLDAQLARPVFTLAAAGRGEHVMTVHVTPDNLGPVTVRAHVGVDGVRVELFAPTDAGRDALRAILPDLRRDLGSTGLTGTLDLSSQNQPSPQHQALADGRTAGQHGEGRAGHDSRSGGDDRSRSSRGETDRAADRLPLPAADGAIHSIDLIV
jgi:flagellar hook-length control protein FliK